MNSLCAETWKGQKVIPYSEEKNTPDAIRNEKEILIWLLNRLGIPRNTAGYSYLFHIVLKIMKTDTVKVKLTTNLYPEIADELNSSAKNIERCLRYSIEAAWNRNKDDIKRILGYYADYKPYSSELILLLADKLRNISKNEFFITS